MGDILEFKRRESSQKYSVSVCDSLQNYQVFEASTVSKPQIEPAYTTTVWFRDDEVEIDGPGIWLPLTIEGDQEIAEAIKYGEPPIRVTFQSNKKKAWYEISDVSLSSESEEGRHLLYFMSCIEHS